MKVWKLSDRQDLKLGTPLERTVRIKFHRNEFQLAIDLHLGIHDFNEWLVVIVARHTIHLTCREYTLAAKLLLD